MWFSARNRDGVSYGTNGAPRDRGGAPNAKAGAPRSEQVADSPRVPRRSGLSRPRAYRAAPLPLRGVVRANETELGPGDWRDPLSTTHGSQLSIECSAGLIRPTVCNLFAVDAAARS